MPMASMLLQFLGIWLVAFVSGMIASAWFDLSDSLVLYGLLLAVARLVAWRFTRVHQRGLSGGEARWAARGMAAIALGTNMLFQVLVAQVSTPGSTLLPPPALSVTLGFLAMLAPAYLLAAHYCVDAANRGFQAALAQRLARAPMQPAAGPAAARGSGADTAPASAASAATSQASQETAANTPSLPQAPALHAVSPRGATLPE